MSITFLALIQQAARLKNLETVAIYRKDACTLREMAKARGWKFEHLIDEYRGQILLDLNFNQDLEPENGSVVADWVKAWGAKNHRAKRADFFKIPVHPGKSGNYCCQLAVDSHTSRVPVRCNVRYPRVGSKCP